MFHLFPSPTHSTHIALGLIKPPGLQSGNCIFEHSALDENFKYAKRQMLAPFSPLLLHVIH